MKIENINITDTIAKTQAALNEAKDLSPSLRAAFETLILLISLLVNRLNLNSRNSSKPPSSDPNRSKNLKNGDRKSGGQKGHVGTTLKKVDNPDEIVTIEVDPTTLPSGNYQHAGYEARQVFDIDISRVITEFRAQVLIDDNGKRFVAPFPAGVTKAAQYGNGLKSHAVYMSQFQLIPYNRIQDYFRDQLHIPISEGSIVNFNRQAFAALADFSELVKKNLKNASFAHADETGINIAGKRRWLHCMSNNHWTLYYPHEKRGIEAFDSAGVLPDYKGILCHDHWKPYYRLGCSHSLCNAHHIRELTRAWEQDEQKWAFELKELLETINAKVIAAGGAVDALQAELYRNNYREIIRKGESECPAPVAEKGKRGRCKKSKSRNLLERLRDFEEDTLRFMTNKIVSFTNNQGENDIRMTKVQQKISGSFRSFDGAETFCRIRSYLSTCRKQGIKSSCALSLLFNGELPPFTVADSNSQ